MPSARTTRGVILVLVTTGVALLLGGGAAATSRDGALGPPVGAAAAFTSSVRLPDVVMRTETERDQTRIGRLSQSGPLMLFVPVMVSVLAMLADARRPRARTGAPVWSRSPRRHSVPLRAPPSFRAP